MFLHSLEVVGLCGLLVFGVGCLLVGTEEGGYEKGAPFAALVFLLFPFDRAFHNESQSKIEVERVVHTINNDIANHIHEILLVLTVPIVLPE